MLKPRNPTRTDRPTSRTDHTEQKKNNDENASNGPSEDLTGRHTLHLPLPVQFTHPADSPEKTLKTIKKLAAAIELKPSQLLAAAERRAQPRPPNRQRSG